MILTLLKLNNFRNYRFLDFRPEKSLNIIRGANAQGKTNLLESIHHLSTTRPLRATKENELISWGENSAIVSGEVMRDSGVDTSLEIALSSEERKQVRINGMLRPRVIDLFGNLNTVTFSAQDLGLVRGEPAERRRFMDLEIAQIRPSYVTCLAHFRRALAQRNELLKRHAEGNGPLTCLEAWDEQIVQYGAQMMEMRWEFIKRLSPLADDAHQRLTEGVETFRVTYHPNVQPPEDMNWAQAYEEQLETKRNQEIRIGRTLVGPQRDDVALFVNEKEVRTYGSQGQQRTAVLSLKLAEAQLAQEEVGEPPVVLLDDVMSDLDAARRAKVMSFLTGNTQVFITCTDLASFSDEMISQAALFTVEEGQICRD